MNGQGFDWSYLSSSNTSSASSPDQLPRKSFGSYSNDRVVSNNTINSNSSFLNIARSDNNSVESIAHSTSMSGTNDISGLGSLGGGDYGDDDSGIPLSLTAQELTLQESKTYMRWYSDILARTNSRTITMNDVFNFLVNFKISQITKDKINRIFQKIIYSINIGEFFALLRLISHTLNGADPSRKLIKVQAPVPTPPSILSKKRQNDDDNDSEGNNHNDNDSLLSSSNIANGGSYNGDSNGLDQKNGSSSLPEPNKPLDIDSFTQFILTGERPDDTPKKKRNKKLKSVKFSDNVVTDVHEDSFMPSPSGSPFPQSETLDYSLPMDQLLDRVKSQPQVPIKPPSPDEEEQDLLKDMENQINHFQNLHSVDTALRGGTSSSIHFHDGYSSENLLRPNVTGPNDMARLFSPSPEPGLLKPNMTGPVQMAQLYDTSRDDDYQDEIEPQNYLKPNVTGPADMARFFPPDNMYNNNNNQDASAPKMSLQSFTNQMTGNTIANTLQNARVTDDGSPSRPQSSSFSTGSRPTPPPPAPTTRRSRSISSPTPRISSPLSNNVTIADPGAPYYGNSLTVGPPPVPIRSPLHASPNTSTANLLNNIGAGAKVPPPPPPSRRRNVSTSIPSPQPTNPPLPPKISIGENSNGLSGLYSNNSSNDSTVNILDDLKALQEEVDKIRDMTGGF
ncbi:hypothetical protein DFJ63DRAFT_289531 [Scheffersomyces coipomensis]|uniref:uncharacterized protein n=1 Tax=Scheffersomyces coipomensis TaxID=1788519 RepID=UPI00315D24A9